MESPPVWSELFEAKRAIHRLYPEVWDVPLARKRWGIVAPLLRPGIAVLDVGAGEREWEQRLKDACPGLQYASVDLDGRKASHDFRTLTEASASDRRFDLALFLEVIEHLPMEEGLSALRAIHDLLAPGGALVASTPNTWCPARFFEDVTHRTAWSYENFGGGMVRAGFRDVKLYRAYNAPLLERGLRRLSRPLHRWIGVDYAPTIFAVARK